MQPSIGRVVHYLPTSDEIASCEMGAGVHPAIITAVREGDVSLFVMFGGELGKGGSCYIGRARQSIRPEPGCWHWPPRVS